MKKGLVKLVIGLAVFLVTVVVHGLLLGHLAKSGTAATVLSPGAHSAMGPLALLGVFLLIRFMVYIVLPAHLIGMVIFLLYDGWAGSRKRGGRGAVS